MRYRSRRGFTLLELMLVMALLVAITALTIPTLSGPLDNHRLRQGADQVRSSWVRARATAMEKGRTYVFTYSLGAGEFTLVPWLSGDDYLESDQLTSLGIEADGDSLALAASMAPKTERLPENVYFLGSQTAADMRAEVLAMSTPDAAAGIQAAEGPASPPIFFYPDGTTSTARLVVANQRGRCVTVTLRGLTGVVHVSGLQSQNELSF